MYVYLGVLVQPYLGKDRVLARMTDDMNEVVWRPYRYTEPWDEDEDEMGYFFCPQFLLCQIPSVIERFCFL